MKAFTPFTFKHGATIRNRIVLAPMTTYSSNVDLTLSDEEEAYYNQRATQVSLVITAATAVSKNAQAFEHQISIRDERYLESMKRLASTIKKEGSLAVVQLHHGGRMNRPGLYPNQDIVSASAVPANRDYTVTPRALRISEVNDVIDDFSRATKIAIKAGFDGVELHGANTYLLQQFFSPHSNRRTDEFGGSLQKRLTFPMKLVDRIIDVRDRYANESFIIGYRLSPEEVEEPGITINDTLVLVDELSKRDIDYIHLSQGSYLNTSIRDKQEKRTVISRVKTIVNNRVALIGAGNIHSKEDIEKALSSGYDLVALGMVALSDPFVVDHLKQNQPIRKILDNESMLPSKLLHRLRSWRGIENKGFTLK